jgi:hypothetical protein
MVAITQEILQALGSPLEIKYVPAEFGDPAEETGYRTQIPFPGVADDAPSVLQQFMWVLQNLAQLKGALAKPSELPPPIN